MDLWDELDKPSNPNQERIRRADPDSIHKFYRGKDFQGYYFFQYISKFDKCPEKLPKLVGISFSADSLSKQESRLTLRLNDTAQLDIFKSLCANLINATKPIPSDEPNLVVEVLVHRVHRWQELLKNSRDKLLTRSEQIGLFGELLILKDFYLHYLDFKDAISAWRGPFSEEQDFSYSGYLIEVKTQLNSSDKKLFISSKDQLDTISGPIIIAHQILTHTSGSIKGSYSLRGLVKHIEQLLLTDNPAVIDTFHGSLTELGYVDRTEYDEEHLLLKDRTFYLVKKDFPRIVPSSLVFGIDDVSYSISIDVCRDFTINEDFFIEKALGITNGIRR